MDETTSFATFVARLRARDAAAAEQFVEKYGPIILRAIGSRLTRLGLRRELDPADICQEVLMKFFDKVGDELKSDSPEELIKLLVCMTHNQILDAERHFHTERHGSGEHRTQHSHLEDIVSAGDAPSHDLNQQEQLEQIHEQMSEEEWDLAKARASGLTWDEIAAEFGQSVEALRKHLSRAVDRVRHDLNPE